MRSEDPNQAVVKATNAYYVNGKYANNDLIVVMTMEDNHPVDALKFAKLLTAQVKLLQSIGKKMGGGPIQWAIIEAAIIAEKAQFTLRGYPRDALKKAIAAETANPSPEFPAASIEDDSASPDLGEGAQQG